MFSSLKIISTHGPYKTNKIPVIPSNMCYETFQYKLNFLLIIMLVANIYKVLTTC